MDNIWVSGAAGQLGSELKDLAPEYTGYNFIFTDYQSLDITNYNKVQEFTAANRINIVINCAAYTKVDKAEEEPALADAINHLAVANLAEVAKKQQLSLIHISTDYVFDGTSSIPYAETDTPNPQNVYGLTKLKGEVAMQKINPAHSIIIRTSWVYSSYGNNFVKSMLGLARENKELKIVSDQLGSPTYAGDLAITIMEILPKIKNNKVEVYHYSNEGVCSWYDFARAIFEIKECTVEVRPVASNEFPTPAKRPFYSHLNKDKIIRAFELEVPYWSDSLVRCLQKIY